ncbi:unnamed protein product [Chilo suppressalis]|uniref:Uncharacterized protein n=1 Tax=Chilo suppressalis TaxID=168631 RepID=A0ABN8B3K9_CHISP|nr:unnamed protein product [Chilo suppressalis]
MTGGIPRSDAAYIDSVNVNAASPCTVLCREAHPRVSTLGCSENPGGSKNCLSANSQRPHLNCENRSLGGGGDEVVEERRSIEENGEKFREGGKDRKGDKEVGERIVERERKEGLMVDAEVPDADPTISQCYETEKMVGINPQRSRSMGDVRPECVNTSSVLLTKEVGKGNKGRNQKRVSDRNGMDSKRERSRSGGSRRGKGSSREDSDRERSRNTRGEREKSGKSEEESEVELGRRAMAKKRPSGTDQIVDALKEGISAASPKVSTAGRGGLHGLTATGRNTDLAQRASSSKFFWKAPGVANAGTELTSTPDSSEHDEGGTKAPGRRRSKRIRNKVGKKNEERSEEEKKEGNIEEIEIGNVGEKITTYETLTSGNTRIERRVDGFFNYSSEIGSNPEMDVEVANPSRSGLQTRYQREKGLQQGGETATAEKSRGKAQDLIDVVMSTVQGASGVKEEDRQAIIKAAQGLHSLVEKLVELTVTEENRRLRANNERLEQELAHMRKENQAYKQAFERAAREAKPGGRSDNADEALERIATPRPDPVPPKEWQEAFKADLMNSMGRVIGARIEGLKGRLLPEINLAPPLEARKRANAAPKETRPAKEVPATDRGPVQDSPESALTTEQPEEESWTTVAKRGKRTKTTKESVPAPKPLTEASWEVDGKGPSQAL